MLRELTEETIIEAAYDEELVGFIYDDTSAVGRVHLGVVHLLTLSSPAARAREADLVDSGFEAIDGPQPKHSDRAGRPFHLRCNFIKCLPLKIAQYNDFAVIGTQHCKMVCKIGSALLSLRVAAGT